MYLEGIFNGSEDIKQQLKDEVKKFAKNDKTFIVIILLLIVFYYNYYYN